MAGQIDNIEKFKKKGVFGSGRPAHAATSLRGRPRGRLRAITAPLSEDLAAPDAPGLGPLEKSTGQAGLAHRAVGAEGLGQFELGRGLGEPQPRLLHPARQGTPNRCGGQRDVGSPRLEMTRGKPVRGSPGRRWDVGRSIVCCTAAPPRTRLRRPAVGPPTGGRGPGGGGLAERERPRIPGSGSAASRRTGGAVSSVVCSRYGTRGWCRLVLGAERSAGVGFATKRWAMYSPRGGAPSLVDQTEPRGDKGGQTRSPGTPPWGATGGHDGAARNDPSTGRASALPVPRTPAGQNVPRGGDHGKPPSPRVWCRLGAGLHVGALEDSPPERENGSKGRLRRAATHLNP